MCIRDRDAHDPACAGVQPRVVGRQEQHAPKGAALEGLRERSAEFGVGEPRAVARLEGKGLHGSNLLSG